MVYSSAVLSVVLKESAFSGSSGFTAGQRHAGGMVGGGCRAGRAAASLSQDGLTFPAEILGCVENDVRNCEVV